MASTEQLRGQLERVAADLGEGTFTPIVLERPRQADHGDVATNLAMLLAKQLKRAPRQLAETIIERLDLSAAGVSSAEIAGPGFINFRFGQGTLNALLADIIQADQNYGRATPPKRERIQIEFVSANPTGPLHVAHGRGAALGDAIASLLTWAGHEVEREFYVNDAGVQVIRLGESVDARMRELGGAALEIPEGGYHGEYVVEIARELVRDATMTTGDEPGRATRVRDWAVAQLRAEQDRDLRDFGVFFDSYFSESTLYQEKRIEDTLHELKERGLTFESDGATWLRTSAFGDDKDRVLIKSDGAFTYFLPDLAYHREKARRGFDHVIDVWGADHHGYAPRMRAALKALGLENFLGVEIVQMVRIMRGGEEFKISKRAGDFVTLRDLYEETGVDVARYFFLMRRSDAQMVFDLDLALDHSEKNPVYKVQYAHARMSSIFKKADVDPASLNSDARLLDLLRSEQEQELIKQLSTFPNLVERAAEARTPHMVCDYLETTSSIVNSWYHSGNPSRNPELAVLVSDPDLRSARLALARAIQIVLRNGLTLLGLTAPERMEREEIT